MKGHGSLRAAVRSIGVIVAALCAFSATTIHSSAGEPFEVRIDLHVDPSITSRRLRDRLKDEAEAIWSPYGVRLEWTDEGASEPSSNGVSLEASLEREFEKRRRIEVPAVLGRVVVERDTPNWRQIYVSFDATRRVLALRTTVRSTMKGIVLDHELAAALGRVLAHEIGHVLLGPPYHDQAGLMRAAFLVDELAERDRKPFRLSCSGVDRLRSRLSALTESAQFSAQPVPTLVDVPDPSGTERDFPSDGALCTGIQPTR